MVRKILLKIRALIDDLLGESPGQNNRQRKVTVVGSNNSITIINGNASNSNLMLPNNQNNVKRFPRRKSVKCRQKCLADRKRGRRS